jgi:E3 ubiquitin-protein ligase RNF14
MGGLRGNGICYVFRSSPLIKGVQSIYPDSTAATSEKPGIASGDNITLELPISLDGCRVELVSDATQKPSSGSLSIALSHLPSIFMKLRLPSSYPSTSRPQLMSISCNHSWLSDDHTERLADYLRNKLEDTPLSDGGILWDLCEWFRSGEFLRSMKLLTPDGLKCVNSHHFSIYMNYNPVRLSHPAPALLLPILRQHDALANSLAFESQTYGCSICITSIKGKRAVLLSCSHVFCKECLVDFWTLLVTEGDIFRVGCAHEQCVKEKRLANEQELVSVLPAMLVERWKLLRQKRAAELDPTLQFCPVTLCQALVSSPYPEIPAGQETGSQRLRTCDQCQFSFCSLCRRSWCVPLINPVTQMSHALLRHGSVAPCPVPFSVEFFTEYLETTVDSPRRKELDQRYGRKEIWEMIEHYNAVQSAKEVSRAQALHWLSLPENSLEREWIETRWGKAHVLRKVVQVKEEMRLAALSEALIEKVTTP